MQNVCKIGTRVHYCSIFGYGPTEREAFKDALFNFTREHGEAPQFDDAIVMYREADDGEVTTLYVGSVQHEARKHAQPN